MHELQQPACWKMAYPNRREANRALRQIQAIQGRGRTRRNYRRESNAYKCPYCQFWHLTSKPQSPTHS